MSAEGFGDFFMSDEDATQPAQQPAQPVAPNASPAAPLQPVAPPPVAQVPTATPAPAPMPEPVPVIPEATPAVAPAAQPAPAPVTAQPAPAAPAIPPREAQLAALLDRLMSESMEIEASALVSLDGFTMASALPEGMHEDRVGAMSAAILGLGERAAAELGRGSLSQVFIEGEGGYVLLMAAGHGAVLTCLAGPEAKLGLVLYDMRATAEEIAGILG